MPTASPPGIGRPGLLGDLEVPLIVALHGYCVGGGTMLTLSADYRLAAAT